MPPDEFDTFFDQLSNLKSDENPPANFGEAPVVADPAVVPAVETPVVADTPATDVPTGEVQATGDGGEPAVIATEEAPVEPAAITPPAPVQGDNTELLSRLADLLDKRQPAAPVVQPQPQAPTRIYTDEETTRLQSFQKDWPDIFEAFQLLARGTTVQNNAYVFNEMARVLGPQLQNMQTVQVEHQYDALRRSIPDYDTVRDPVISWVKSDKAIPSYLRTAYNGVIENGDVGEITDLVNRWRQATGTAQPGKAAAAPAKSANELSPAAKQAAAALAPVAAKRATVVQSQPEGFDEAFDAFAKA